MPEYASPDILHDAPQTPERMPQELFFKLLNRVGNHEAKLVTLGIVLSEPAEWFTRADLEDEIESRHERYAGWIPSAAVAFGYLETLQPTGLINQGFTQGRRSSMAVACRASEVQKWHPACLAMVGEELEWSLFYPDISLQQILGRTGSPSSVRSPEVRFTIYEELLTSPIPAPAAADIISALSGLYPRGDLIRTQLQALRDLEIIDINSSHSDEFDPLLEIIDPVFSHDSLAFEQLRPETKVLYKAMQSFHATGISILTSSELEKACFALDNTIDRTVLHKLVNQGRSLRSTTLPGIRLVDNKDIETGKYSRVSLRPGVKGAVYDLTTRLEKVVAGEGIEESRQKALYILEEPELFSYLMAKARRFSSIHKASPAEGGHERLASKVALAVDLLGRATVREAQARLKKDGIILNRDVIRLMLISLVEGGDFEVSLVQPNPAKRTRVAQYSRVEE